MAEEIVLRQCSEEDIESVLDLWRAAGSTPSSTDTSDYLLGTVNSSASSVILVVSGGEIAGSMITAFDGWRGNLYRLSVHPDYRRRGIAKMLLSDAEAWLKSRGVKKVGAVVEKDHSWATGFWDSTDFYLEPMDLRYVRDL